jgi:hypothetical protein
MSGRTLVNISSNTIYRNVNDSDDQFDVFAGASLVLRAVDTFTDDAITGAGLVRNNGQTTIDGGLTLTGDTTFVNSGALYQAGLDVVLGQSATDAVTVRNTASGVWDLESSGGFFGTGPSVFVNLGAFDSAGGTSEVDANFYDRGGSINISGVLDFESAGDVNRFIDDTISNFDGPGILGVNGGVFVSSTISTWQTYLDNVRLVGDVTISSTSVNLSNINLGAGALADLTENVGSLSLGGEFYGAGEIQIQSAATVTLADDVTLVGAMSFVNSGVSTFESDDYPSQGTGVTLSATPWSGDTVTIENSAGGYWEDVGANSVFQQLGSASGSSVFINNGTFRENTAGGVTFDIPVVNDDVMETGDDADPHKTAYDLTFNSPLTGDGTVAFGLGAFVDSSVGSGQTFDFTPFTPFASQTLGGNLTIIHPDQFSGTITGFDQSPGVDDAIAIGLQFQKFDGYVPNDAGTGGSLEFTDTANGQQASLTLVGSYNPSDFHFNVTAYSVVTYSG